MNTLGYGLLYFNKVRLRIAPNNAASMKRYISARDEIKSALATYISDIFLKHTS